MTRALAAALAAATALVLGLAPAAPAAPRKVCKPVSDRTYGKSDRIRVSRGFKCRDARRSIKGWYAQGASTREGLPGPVDIPGWSACTGRISGGYPRISCRVRTSFGGTRPERTYRMTFRYYGFPNPGGGD